jgi:hypothetical protein
VIVHGVQPGELDRIFPLAAPWISAIPRLCDYYKLQDVYDALEAGNWQLWIALDRKIEGVLLTTVISYPKARDLVLLGIAGNRMREWIDRVGIIEDYARAAGCEKVVVMGARKGFARMLPQYTGGRVVLEKKL